MSKKIKDPPADPIGELISLSKFGQNPIVRKKGSMDGELTRLVLKKLNISDRDLKKADQMSIKRNLETAKEFEVIMHERKFDPELLIRRMRLMPDESPTYLADWKNAESIFVPVDGENPFRHTHRHLEGRSTAGVGDSEFKDASALPSYDFFFGPTGNAPYAFALPLFILFPYFLIADDGPFNDRYATMGMMIEVLIFQQFNLPLPTATSSEFGQIVGGSFRNVISKHVTNESLLDFCLFKETIEFDTPFLQKNVLTKVSVTVRLITNVKGEGSIVDVNMNYGNGFVLSEGLTVIRKTYT